jgi:hypothetical protein
MKKKKRRTTTTPSDPAAPHFLFGAWCQRGSETFILSLMCGIMNFMYLDSELWLVITLNSYVCKTMWAWDLWLCACGDLFCFYSLRMLYARLKILDECCFTLVFWKPGESRFFSRSIQIFQRIRVWPRQSGLLCARFLLHPCWVYKLSWAFHYYLLHITRTPLV